MAFAENHQNMWGLGFRLKHYNDLLSRKPKEIQFLEALSENYMGLSKGGIDTLPFRKLIKLREFYPMNLHGVSLSIGSTEPLDQGYLNKLKHLINAVDPIWVSDHLCWTHIGHPELHDLMPVPMTWESLEWITSRIDAIQNHIGRPLVLENPSTYIEFARQDFNEWDFLSLLCERSGAKLLLDINNVYVSSTNHGWNPQLYIQSLRKKDIAYMHLAGHSKQDELLIDTHDKAPSEAVLDLFRSAYNYLQPGQIMIEWDAKIPALNVLLSEIERAKECLDPHHFELEKNSERAAWTSVTL